MGLRRSFVTEPTLWDRGLLQRVCDRDGSAHRRRLTRGVVGEVVASTRPSPWMDAYIAAGAARYAITAFFTLSPSVARFVWPPAPGPNVMPASPASIRSVT